MSGTRSLHQAKGIGVKVSASPDTSTRRERDSGDATENESTDLLRTMCDTSFRLQAALRQGEPRSLPTLSLKIPAPWKVVGGRNSRCGANFEQGSAEDKTSLDRGGIARTPSTGHLIGESSQTLPAFAPAFLASLLNAAVA